MERIEATLVQQRDQAAGGTGEASLQRSNGASMGVTQVTHPELSAEEAGEQGVDGSGGARYDMLIDEVFSAM